MKLQAYALCAVILCCAISVGAQQPPSDPIGENFFPPELVLQHQQEIGLTEEQKSSVKAEITKAATRFTEVQLQLQDEMGTLVSLISKEHVDEQQVLAEVDKVLSLEREAKRTHLMVVIRIKNLLRPDQQTKLREIMRDREK